MAHGDAREGKWKGNWRMEWVASTLYTTSEHGVIQHYYRWCAQLGCQCSTELTPPADLNGLVPLAERRNLVSARVPPHFNWPLHEDERETLVEWCWQGKTEVMGGKTVPVSLCTPKYFSPNPRVRMRAPREHEVYLTLRRLMSYTSRMGAPYIYDISSLKVNNLTLILLTQRKWWAPNNASK